MSGYTVKNLGEVEDIAAKQGFGELMEARFARDDLDCEQHGLSLQRFRPGARQPFAHRHGEQEEVYVVTGGGGRIHLDGDVVELRRLDAVRVAPATVRSFEAGPEGLEIVAFGDRGVADVEMVSEEPAG
jgi:quercetin dioxygenase-like cupin family protein